ncbi:MAG: SLC13 family permease [Actinobacteria bacterium]|nr:SLC13 family permease [Actinomycetota bacterium]
MNTSLVAIIIFLLTYIAIATEKINRTVVAFIGSLFLLLFKIFTLEKAISYISWETIGLLLGMFIIVGALSEAGFFTYLALVTAKILRYSPSRIFIVFPIITGFLSGFMDSITVMLFFATLTFELCKILKIEAAPVIITEVIMANIGGSMTLVGDPPNVILGLKLGYFFNDFVFHNGPVAIIAGAITLFYCYMVSRKGIIPKEAIDKTELQNMNPNDAIKDIKQLKIALGAFGFAIIFLITHMYIEKFIHIPLTVPLAALVPAFVMLAILGVEKSRIVITKIDYEVLLFFIGLFIVVGGLEYTGVVQNIAEHITGIFNGNHIGLISTLLWGSGFASGIIDNVPFALSMAYVLQDIVKFAGVPALSIMLWATSLGTDIGGNFTPIGASANVVAYTSMEKKGLRIGWGRWLKLAVPATFISLIICNIGLYIKYIINFY